MITHQTRGFGSPSRYIQGRFELTKLKEYTDIYGKTIYILVDSFFFNEYQEKFSEMYQDTKMMIREYQGEITAEKIDAYLAEAGEFVPEVVVGMGGGKTMDTGRALADAWGAATIIVPTTASTDAPVIGLSVLYDESGKHIGARHYRRNPDLVLLDTDIIVKAPVRFLVSGMGDALATFIETRANVESDSANYIDKGYRVTLAAQAIAMACHETILSKGVRAKQAAENGLCTVDVEDVIEANTLLSGLGVQNSGCAGAHSVAEGLTVLPGAGKMLHGELVAFGCLVQLIIEGREEEEFFELFEFFKEVGLPTDFEMLNIGDATPDDIMRVAEASMHSYWEREPFPVTPLMISDAIRLVDVIAKKYE